MAYLSYEDYLKYPTGVTVPEEEYEPLARYAEITVNGLLNRAPSEPAPEAVRESYALQTAFLYIKGGVKSIGQPEVSKETIGGYSYSTGYYSKTHDINCTPVSPAVRVRLLKAGLLYRGGGHV